MVRLSSITTRTGDDGTTGLGDGTRVSKHSLRIEAIGAVDEANAALGIAILHVAPALKAQLTRIQNDLFDMGADLCMPRPAAGGLQVTARQVARLEAEQGELNEALAPLNSFVLPGGSAAAAYLHLARTVVRRAERMVVALHRDEPLNPELVKYINRLSDYLFIMARYVNDKGAADVLWVPGQG